MYERLVIFLRWDVVWIRRGLAEDCVLPVQRWVQGALPDLKALHVFGPYLMNEIEHFLQLARTFCWNIATCETVFYAVPLQLKERQSKQISNATTFSASFMRRLSQLLRVLWKHQMQE